jgi:hypothetical protein
MYIYIEYDIIYIYYTIDTIHYVVYIIQHHTSHTHMYIYIYTYVSIRGGRLCRVLSWGDGDVDLIFQGVAIISHHISSFLKFPYLL